MSTPTVRANFTRLSRQETMLAMPGPGTVVTPPASSTRTARQALEAALINGLAAPPCHVLFSGGRGSSALLALAVHVARRYGFPEPVSVTVRHRDAPESDETRWQELVLEHLRVRDHIVLELLSEQRLLGDVATSALRGHGLVWPESIQLHGAVYRHLDAGSIVSGAGADTVLGGHRMGAVRGALALTRPRRRHLRHGLRAVTPAPLRRRALAARTHTPPWLRGPAAEEYLRQLLTTSGEPLRWDAATRASMRSRRMSVLASNVDAAVTEYGSLPVTPFTDLRVVDALAREAGPLGWGNRTAIFRRLFHDVLPGAVLSHDPRVSISSTRWGPREREFARAWDGEGGWLDHEWIDAEALRAAWLAEHPHPAAGFLLHVAWAHTQHVPADHEEFP